MKITVYSTTICPYCVMLKRWLDDKKIEYTDYLVDENPYAAQMMIRQSGQTSVPFTTFEYNDGTVDGVLGFDRHAIEHILALQPARTEGHVPANDAADHSFDKSNQRGETHEN